MARRSSFFKVAKEREHNHGVKFKSQFTVKFDGVKAVQSHANSKEHEKIMKEISEKKLITEFMSIKNRPQERKVAAIERAQTYDGAVHHHSYTRYIKT